MPPLDSGAECGRFGGLDLTRAPNRRSANAVAGRILPGGDLVFVRGAISGRSSSIRPGSAQGEPCAPNRASAWKVGPVHSGGRRWDVGLHPSGRLDGIGRTLCGDRDSEESVAAPARAYVSTSLPGRHARGDDHPRADWHLDLDLGATPDAVDRRCGPRRVRCGRRTANGWSSIHPPGPNEHGARMAIGMVERLTDSPKTQLPPLTDGRVLVLGETQPNTGWDLRVFAAAGTAGSPIRGDAVYRIQRALSPDGRWVATKPIRPRTEIYVWPFPDVNQGQWQVSTDGDAAAVVARRPSCFTATGTRSWPCRRPRPRTAGRPRQLHG